MTAERREEFIKLLNQKLEAGRVMIRQIRQEKRIEIKRAFENDELSEDAKFPLSKSELLENQGWKVIDLTLDQRVHLSEYLAKIPEKTYNSVDEVAEVLEAVM